MNTSNSSKKGPGIPVGNLPPPASTGVPLSERLCSVECRFRLVIITCLSNSIVYE